MKSLIDSRQPSATSVLGTCQSMASCEEEDGCNEMRNGYDNLRREDELKQLQLFTAKENQRVRFFRIVVVLSILIVGAVISSLTYHTLQREVESDRKDTVSAYSFIFRFNCLTFTHKCSQHIRNSSNRLPTQLKKISVSEFKEFSPQVARLAVQ